MSLSEIIKKNEKLIVFIMLLALTLQSVFSSFYISPTADELKHITRGYIYLKTGDQRFNNVHPLFINSLNAMPLLFVSGINLPLDHASWRENNVIDFSWQFFFHSGNDLEKIFSLSRIVTFILSIVLGILVYLWARKLYGVVSGLFALLLYSFSINIIAYSTLVTNDVGATLFIFFSFFMVWVFYKKPSLKNLLLSGFVFGLALMSKYYALHFVPAMVILLCIAYFKGRPKLSFFDFKNERKKTFANVVFILILFFFASWATLNLGYKFEGTFRSIDYNIAHDPGLDKNIYLNIVEKSASMLPFEKEESLKIVNYFTSNVPTMVPYHYLKGMLFSADVTLERSSKQFYFFEKVFDNPPKYYYIVMFFLKTQIPLLIFLFLTLLFYKKIAKNGIIDDCFLIIPIAIFALLFSLSPVANGFRHFLPIFPFLFVFVSKLPNAAIKNKKRLNYAILALIIWYALASLITFPFYLPYYNEFVGMNNGYKVSINVDVDWGQDLKLLKNYMDKNKINKISFSYFGQVYPEYYNISYNYLPSIGTFRYKGIDSPLNDIEDCRPVKGLVAISVADLKQPFLFKNQSCFEWLQNLTPIDRVGYSIYIYNITKIK